MLKALGFTPGQVVAVYLTMVSVPAVVGCVAGTVVGNLLARPLLEFVFMGPDAGMFHRSVGIAPWVNVLALLGMPGVCVLAALVPAARAHRLSASRAISAGSAPRAGRAPGIQRRLAGSGLPRSVSLGVGLPLASGPAHQLGEVPHHAPALNCGVHPPVGITSSADGLRGRADRRGWGHRRQNGHRSR
ncbi:FtsX-like permease family protein [Streptomyces sp. NPDC006706]|uniref:FtsX-like permease family protein n=1 Tax=Streptomyces sp. NPDC006706 TaxID=3364761 RepID=UPI00369F9750